MTRGGDYPYYDGHPVPIEGRGWALLLASLAVGLLALSFFPPVAFPATFIPALLFLGIPLLTLFLLVGPATRALFRPVGLKELALMVAFGALTLAGSVFLAFLLTYLGALAPNPVVETMATMTNLDLAKRLAPTVPQLLGEELFGILPFLATLWLCTAKLHLGRKTAIAIALLVSALIFGAAHLPTYDWHWAQSLIGIGGARIFLTLAYIATRNLWVSTGAHILNDWTGFILTFESSHMPMGSEG